MNTVEREILYIQYTATPLLRGRRGPGEKKIYYGLHYIHATVVQIDLSQVFTYRIVFTPVYKTHFLLQYVSQSRDASYVMLMEFFKFIKAFKSREIDPKRRYFRHSVYG